MQTAGRAICLVSKGAQAQRCNVHVQCSKCQWPRDTYKFDYKQILSICDINIFILNFNSLLNEKDLFKIRLTFMLIINKNLIFTFYINYRFYNIIVYIWILLKKYNRSFYETFHSKEHDHQIIRRCYDFMQFSEGKKSCANYKICITHTISNIA